MYRVHFIGPQFEQGETFTEPVEAWRYIWEFYPRASRFVQFTPPGENVTYWPIAGEPAAEDAVAMGRKADVCIVGLLVDDRRGEPEFLN